VTERIDEFKERQEALVEEFSDVFADDCGTPILRAWTVVAAFDDAGDEKVGLWEVISRKGQWRFESAGLLDFARQSFLGVFED
jgi:hypothetical protein